jgi:ribosomal protein L16 Arg81 hydroxylase
MITSENGKLVGFVQLPPRAGRSAPGSNNASKKLNRPVNKPKNNGKEQKEPLKATVPSLEERFKKITAEVSTRKKPQWQVIDELEQMLKAYREDNRKLQERFKKLETESTTRIRQLGTGCHELNLSNERQKKELEELRKQLREAHERARVANEKCASIVATTNKLANSLIQEIGK